MIDEKPLTEEEREIADAAEAEKETAEAKALIAKREARTAKLLELRSQLDAWEDRALIVWHKLEQRKIDLLFLGDTPRGTQVRDEAKKHLAEFVELRKMGAAAAREYDKLDEEAAGDSKPFNWAPVVGGFFGGALASAVGRVLSKATKVVVEPAPVTQTATAENPTVPAAGEK